jgi:hypothetical protein
MTGGVLRDRNMFNFAMDSKNIPWAAFVFAAFVSGASASENGAACEATRTLKACGQGETICACDLTTLRPLQSAVGMSEVESKKDKIQSDMKGECKNLKDDPIKVVSGPDGQLFITDHHHLAYAWLLVEDKRNDSPKMAICEIVNAKKELPLIFKSDDEFWASLEKKHLIRRPPPTLASLSDDPYRSLAWLVQKKRGGFCKTELEFAEFRWADFFREHLGIEIKDAHNVDPCGREVNAAVELSHSSIAKNENLPGYSPTLCKEHDECSE